MWSAPIKPSTLALIERPPSLDLVDVTEDHAFLVVGPVACVIWRGHIHKDAMRETERLGMRALENSPEGAGLLFYPEGSTPPRELRELSASINSRLAARGAVGVAGVFSRDGLLGAIQRGIATGMTVLSARSYPMKLFGDTKTAVGWLGTRLRQRGVRTQVEPIARVLSEFRAEYLAEGPSVSAQFAPE